MPDTIFSITESFYSVQGEGFYSGVPAYFLRLAGCNVRCAWCDSKKTWIVNKCKKLTIENLLTNILKTNAKMVVITGGEPLLHNLTTLCMALKEKGISTHLETSGTQPLSGLWDWITLSPKQHAPPLDSIFSSVNELKIVLTNANDILWAEKNAALCSPHCRLFLQPEWSNRKIALPIILEYIKQHPQWRLSVQLHKIIGVP